MVTVVYLLAGMMPSAIVSFTSPTTQRRSCFDSIFRSISNTNDGEEVNFDPFLQSPHSFGSNDGDNNENGSISVDESTGTTSFGFFSYAETSSVSMSAIDDLETSDDITSTSSTIDTTSDLSEFDPLLSPHAYANGADAAPVDMDSNVAAPQKISYSTVPYDKDVAVSDAAELFDPLLSPHAYANGADAAPVPVDSNNKGDSAATISTAQKLGILLIDHGSRRQASNDHIHDIARMYENRLNNKQNENPTQGGTPTTVVRAAHMEISRPSIADSLRDIITVDRVTKVVCVPYFLSPGRHATEDVPQLIAEAQQELDEAGLLLESEILVSSAIGTHLDSMLGAVDDLVEWTLND